jgi:O-antigen/teichoic acid export membrane protein
MKENLSAGSASESQTTRGKSLRDVAVSGGLWTGAQVVINKMVSLGGTVVMMYLLNPEQYGLASIATSLLTAVTLLAPFTLSDVLLARPSEVDRLMGTANRLCIAVTVLSIVALMALAPWAAHHYQQPALFGACIVMALRPVVELMLLGPQTRLRSQLRFRTLASIDMLTQSLATLIGIAMAWAGAGYISIVLPQIAFTGVRALLYSWACPAPRASSKWISAEAGRMFRAYWLSGLGQYVHGGLFVATPLVIGQFADAQGVGYYSMSFALSASINVMVAVSMGLALQPVFAQMSGDYDRQASAFLRACRTIATIAMPACLLQAALSPAGFHVFLPERWFGAIAMTQVLCVGQAFYFPVNPAMGLLKAQGRFGAFFAWQAIQLLLTLLAMFVAGHLADDYAALAVVAVASACPVVSSPFGVWLCVRHRKTGMGGTLSIFGAPTLASVMAIAPPYVACELLLPAGTSQDWTELVAVPTVAVFVYPLLLRTFAPDLHRELAFIVRSVAERLHVPGIGVSS